MIDAEKANYTISRMCRLLNIDRRRYYEWAKRRAAGPSAAEQRRAELTGNARHHLIPYTHPPGTALSRQPRARMPRKKT